MKIIAMKFMEINMERIINYMENNKILFIRLLERELDCSLRGEYDINRYKNLNPLSHSLSAEGMSFLKEVTYKIEKRKWINNYSITFSVPACGTVEMLFNIYGKCDSIIENYSSSDLKVRNLSQKRSYIVMSLFLEIIEKIADSIQEYSFNRKLWNDKLGKFNRNVLAKEYPEFQVGLRNEFSNEIVITNIIEDFRLFQYIGDVVEADIVNRSIYREHGRFEYALKYDVVKFQEYLDSCNKICGLLEKFILNMYLQ